MRVSVSFLWILNENREEPTRGLRLGDLESETDMRSPHRKLYVAERRNLLKTPRSILRHCVFFPSFKHCVDLSRYKHLANVLV